MFLGGQAWFHRLVCVFLTAEVEENEIGIGFGCRCRVSISGRCKRQKKFERYVKRINRESEPRPPS